MGGEKREEWLQGEDFMVCSQTDRIIWHEMSVHQCMCIKGLSHTSNEDVSFPWHAITPYKKGNQAFWKGLNMKSTSRKSIYIMQELMETYIYSMDLSITWWWGAATSYDILTAGRKRSRLDAALEWWGKWVSRRSLRPNGDAAGSSSFWGCSWSCYYKGNLLYRTIWKLSTEIFLALEDTRYSMPGWFLEAKDTAEVLTTALMQWDMVKRKCLRSEMELSGRRRTTCNFQMKMSSY